MAKIIAFVLICFLFGCADRKFDCTKADYDKIMGYIKWCQPNIGTGQCQEQAKELFCKEMIDPRIDIKDSLTSYILLP